MLDSNYFGLSTKKSKWRSPLSLRGLRSEETDINELNKYLRFGEVSADQSKSRLLSASCLSVHNAQNMVIVGARPDNRYNHSTNNGELQIYRVDVTENEEDDLPADMDRDGSPPPDSYGAAMGGASEGVGASWNVDDHDVAMTQCKKWQIGDGIVATDWRDGVLLVATAEGRVYFYRTDFGDGNIYLVAHNEVSWTWCHFERSLN